MAFNVSSLLGWFGWGGGAMGDRNGVQQAVPSVGLVEGVTVTGPDAALQLDCRCMCMCRSTDRSNWRAARGCMACCMTARIRA